MRCWCTLPLCPVCHRCPAAGHAPDCASEEARALLAAWLERERAAQAPHERAVGGPTLLEELLERVDGNTKGI
jgi:hypothetical protein